PTLCYLLKEKKPSCCLQISMVCTGENVRKVYSPSLVVLYIFTKWVVYQYYKRLVTISSSKTSNDALVPLIQWALQTRALFEVIHLVGRLKAFRTDAILAPLVVACIRSQAPMEAMYRGKWIVVIIYLNMNKYIHLTIVK